MLGAAPPAKLSAGGAAIPLKAFEQMRHAPKNSLLCLLLLFCLAGLCRAQSSGGIENPLSPSKQRESETIFGSPQEELKYRASVKHAESNHREMVTRARESTALVSDVRSAFERSKSLAVEDLKKLERVEKLARKIRGTAGGGDDDEPLQDPPAQLEGAIARLAEATDDLLKRVEKTSRFVTSASVVERSNEVIEIVRHIRTFFPK